MTYHCSPSFSEVSNCARTLRRAHGGNLTSKISVVKRNHQRSSQQAIWTTASQLSGAWGARAVSVLFQRLRLREGWLPFQMRETIGNDLGQLRDRLV